MGWGVCPVVIWGNCAGAAQFAALIKICCTTIPTSYITSNKLLTSLFTITCYVSV